MILEITLFGKDKLKIECDTYEYTDKGDLYLFKGKNERDQYKTLGILPKNSWEYFMKVGD